MKQIQINEEPQPREQRPLAVEQRDPQLDEYLDQVVDRLGRAVASSHRQEIRRELATHLEALVDAYLELGSSRQDAVDAAIRQLGAARKVGDSYRSTLRGTSLKHRDCLFAVPCFLLTILFFSHVTLALGAVFGTPAYTLLLSGPLLPVLLGINWARRDEFHTEGWRPLKEVVGASLVTSLLIPTPSYFGSYLPFHGMWAIAQLCMWLLLACAAAGLYTAARALSAKRTQREPA